MHITDLITPDAIAVDVEASSKREVLAHLAGRLARPADLPPARILKSLLQREKLGSTGLERGIAVPHSRIEGLARVHVGFVKLVQPIEFGSNDDVLVDLVCAVIGPVGSAWEPVTSLAGICRALRNDAVSTKVRDARSSKELYAALADTI